VLTIEYGAGRLIWDWCVQEAELAAAQVLATQLVSLCSHACPPLFQNEGDFSVDLTQ
jgi:hypothetical protein